MNKPTGKVLIHGREYETVASRVNRFREAHAEYSLVTDVLHRDDLCVVMKASIFNPAGNLVATGHAEEYRKASSINRTSALENAETSAIGRALAAFGIGGTEFASADEVARAVSGQKGEAPVISPVREAQAKLDDESAEHVEKVADHILEALADNDDKAVFELAESLDSDQRVYLWSLWKEDSKIRSRVKKIVSTFRMIAAQAEKVAA